MRLAGLEAPGGGLHELPDRDRRLAMLVDLLHDRYDCCLIDCPPTIGLLTYNALRAVREAIIPVETGYFALRGAGRQWRTIRQLVERIGRPIACHLVPTLYASDSALATSILKALERDFAGQVVPVVIRDDEAVREAASFGQPVIEYAPNSGSSEDFERLADWLDSRPPAPPVEIDVTSRSGAASNPPATLVGAHSRAAELARLVRGLHDRRQTPENIALPDHPPPDGEERELPAPQPTIDQPAAAFGAEPTDFVQLSVL